MSTASPEKRRGFISFTSLRRTALGLGVIAASLASGATAHAQTKEELDNARIAFQQGVALSAAGNYSAALTKFRAVATVKMTPQVAFNIADCEEHVGKLVSALGNYRLARAQAEGDPRAKDVAARAPEHIDALEARIPKLTIKRGKGAETASIELDGSELGAADISAATPVDPGSHTVAAKVGDKEAFRETVVIAEKETKTFEVKIDAPVAVTTEPPPPEVVEPDVPPPPPPSKAPVVVAFTAGGVGVIMGIAFMAARGGVISDLDNLCDANNVCPSSAKPTVDKGRLYAGLGEVSLVVGAAGVVTGIVLLATRKAPTPPAPTNGSSSEPVARGFRVVPSAPGASIGGLSLVTTF